MENPKMYTALLLALGCLSSKEKEAKQVKGLAGHPQQ